MRLVVAVALASLVAAGGAAVAIVGGGSDSGTSTSTLPPEGTGPTSPSTTPATGDLGPDGSTSTTVDPDAVSTGDPRIDELMRFVERERGLPFLEAPVVEFVDDAEFEERLLEDFDEGLDDLRETEDIFRALRLIDADTDLAESLRQLLGVGVVGFYDPESGELVVRGDELTEYTRLTAVHELVHALDDQHFELDRDEYDDAPDEIGFGFSAVVEGDARRVESAWRAQLTRAQEREVARTEAELAADGAFDPSSFPFILIALILAPYELGEPFTEELWAEGQATLDEAFVTPPDTSEQILHVERYLAGEGRVEVEAPPADGDVIDDGVVGELFWSLLFADGRRTGSSVRAADGWGGDWYVAWRDGDETCVRMDVVLDTARDHDEFSSAAASWADAVGAEFSDSGDLVRLTSCG